MAWSKQGKLERPAFRLMGAPYTSWATLVFLAVVLVLMAIDYPIGTFTIGSLVLIIPLLILAWFLSRKKILAIALKREEFAAPVQLIRAPATQDSAPD